MVRCSTTRFRASIWRFGTSRGNSPACRYTSSLGASAANIHLDVSCHNFGIQEFVPFNGALQEVFPGCPELRGGYVYPNDKPGLGIDLDEEKAAKYPPLLKLPAWTLARRPDGTAVRP